MVKTSVPKLSSFRLKEGLTSKNVQPLSGDKNVENLYKTIFMAINGAGVNMSKASIKGTLLCVIEDI